MTVWPLGRRKARRAGRLPSSRHLRRRVAQPVGSPAIGRSSRSSRWMAPKPALCWLLASSSSIAVLNPVARLRLGGPRLAGAADPGRRTLAAPARAVAVLIAAVAVALCYDAVISGWHAVFRVGQLVEIAAIAIFGYRLARTREPLGMQGLRGESMLLELRDRLRTQGEMPPLPPGLAARDADSLGRCGLLWRRLRRRRADQ